MTVCGIIAVVVLAAFALLAASLNPRTVFQEIVQGMLAVMAVLSMVVAAIYFAAASIIKAADERHEEMTRLIEDLGDAMFGAPPHRQPPAAPAEPPRPRTGPPPPALPPQPRNPGRIEPTMPPRPDLGF